MIEGLKRGYPGECACTGRLPGSVSLPLPNDHPPLLVPWPAACPSPASRSSARLRCKASRASGESRRPLPSRRCAAPARQAWTWSSSPSTGTGANEGLAVVGGALQAGRRLKWSSQPRRVLVGWGDRCRLLLSATAEPAPPSSTSAAHLPQHPGLPPPQVGRADHHPRRARGADFQAGLQRQR